MGFVGALLGYHLYLIRLNRTTREHLKMLDKELPGNPFARSLAKTLRKLCTSSLKRTLLDKSILPRPPFTLMPDSARIS